MEKTFPISQLIVMEMEDILPNRWEFDIYIFCKHFHFN